MAKNTFTKIRGIRSRSGSDVNTDAMFLFLGPKRRRPGVIVTPDQIGGLYRWYKADSIVDADNTQIGIWTDSAGDNDTGEVNAANNPRVKTNILNGKNILRFDGTGGLTTPEFSINTTGGPNNLPNVSMFVVAKFGSTDGGYLFSQENDFIRSIQVLADKTVFIDDGATDVEFASSTPFSGANNTWRIIEVIFKSNDTLEFYENGVARGTGLQAEGHHLRVSQIAVNSPRDVFTEIDIAEIIFYQVALSNPNRVLVEQYLANKYGL